MLFRGWKWLFSRVNRLQYPFAGSTAMDLADSGCTLLFNKKGRLLLQSLHLFRLLGLLGAQQFAPIPTSPPVYPQGPPLLRFESSKSNMSWRLHANTLPAGTPAGFHSLHFPSPRTVRTSITQHHSICASFSASIQNQPVALPQNALGAATRWPTSLAACPSGYRDNIESASQIR